MPAGSRWALVAEAVRSVRAQTFQDWELLVVEDGSEGLPGAALASPPDRRVRLLRSDAAGDAAKGRRGVREATGTWIAMIEPDVVWARTKLEHELRAATNGGESSLTKRENPAPPPPAAPQPRAPEREVGPVAREAGAGLAREVEGSSWPGWLKPRWWAALARSLIGRSAPK
jgi:glycosyltransferase involved in cell wall biosynthesis